MAHILGRGVRAFAGTPEKEKLSVIEHKLTNRIPGGESLGYTASFLPLVSVPRADGCLKKTGAALTAAFQFCV